MTAATQELFGRDAELSRARECLHAARGGRGGVVVVSGEAGIGKSTFAEAVAQQAQALGFRLLSGRAWEFADAPAYFPVRNGLRALGVTLALPGGSDADAFGLWEESLEALARESSRTPIFWLLEDLHAADARTLELLVFLAQPLRALAVTIVITVRSGDPRASGAVLQRLTRLNRDGGVGGVIDLAHLPPTDVVALVQRVAGRTLPAHSIDVWMAKTSGNPLFVVECARAVRAGKSVESALPETVVQVVTERLRTLSDAARGYLGQGALLGRDFSAAAVAQLAQCLPAEVIDALLPAVRAGLLDDTGPGRFRFVHALVRDAIEDAMPARERGASHARAALTLAQQGDAPELVVESARHAIEGLAFMAASDVRAQVDRALAVLQAQGARDRALALWRRWLDTSTEKPNIALLLQTARLASAAGQHAQAHRAAEGAFALAKGGGDALGMAHAALAYGAELRVGILDPVLVRLLGEAESALATLDQPALSCRVRARLAAAMIPGSDEPAAGVIARATIAAARASGDEALLREVLFVAASALIDVVGASAAETHALAGELLTLSLAAGDNVRLLRAYARRVFGHLTLSDFAEFDADVERLLVLAAAHGHPLLSWPALLIASMRALARGRFEDSERFVTEVEQMARITDDAALAQSLAAHRAYRTLALDDEPAMRAGFKTIAKLVERMPGAELYAPPIRAMFAVRLRDRAAVVAELPALARLPSNASIDSLGAACEAIAFAGTKVQREVALELLRPLEDREIHTSHVPNTYEGPVARVLGLLEASLGRHDVAEQRLEAARVHCRAFGLQPWVARLSFERAEVLRELGREDEARPLFQEAAALATELKIVGIAQRARAALGGAGDAPTAQTSALTDQNGTEHAPLSLTREGEVWCIAWGKRSARVRDSRGVQLLAKLVTAPGERVHALALAGDGESFVPDSDAGEVLDPKAVSAYRARLAELDEALETTEAHGEARRAKQLQRERDMLVAEISRAVGLGGRLRKVGSATERARINVTRRLKDALARIAEADAELGRHLDASVRTGTYCSYREEA